MQKFGNLGVKIINFQISLLTYAVKTCILQYLSCCSMVHIKRSYSVRASHFSCEVTITKCSKTHKVTGHQSLTRRLDNNMFVKNIVIFLNFILLTKGDLVSDLNLCLESNEEIVKCLKM